jgi:peptidoglycan/LPS O-acetylase OafA/YrhL
LVQVHKHELHPYVSSVIILGSFALLPVGLTVGLVAYPLNVPAWSLFFEFVASALYGTRFGRLGSRSLAAFVAGSGIAVIAMATWGGPYLYIGFGTPIKFLLGFVRVAYPFWAGVFLFRAAQLRQVPRVPISMIGFVLTSLLLAPFDSPAYSLLMVLAAFPVLVVFGARASFGNLTARLCSAAGRVSYPLYLIHWPVYRVIYRASETMHLTPSPWAMLIGGAVVSVLLAEALLVAFDEPTRMWLTRQLRPHHSQGGRAIKPAKA